MDERTKGPHNTELLSRGEATTLRARTNREAKPVEPTGFACVFESNKRAPREGDTKKKSVRRSDKVWKRHAGRQAGITTPH